MLLLLIILLFNWCCAFELDDEELRAQAQELVSAWHQPQQEMEIKHNETKQKYDHKPILWYHTMPEDYEQNSTISQSTAFLKIPADAFEELCYIISKNLVGICCTYCNQRCIVQKVNKTQIDIVCRLCGTHVIFEK